MGKRANMHQIYVDDAVFAEVKPILDEIGLSRSSFIELIFKALIDSKGKPFAEVQGSLFEGLLKRGAEKVIQNRGK